MEESPWEANNLPVSKKIAFFFNQKVYYCVHKSPPLVFILSQMNSVHTFPPYFP
jgi:hypothetical protein